MAAASLAFGVTLPLWDRLPNVFAFFGKHVFSWASREVCRALVVLAPSTLAMGTTFPVLLTRVAKRRDVGSLPKDAKGRRLGALAARDDYAFGAAPNACFTPVSSSDIDQRRAASSSLLEDLLVVAFTASPRISFQPFGPV